MVRFTQTFIVPQISHIIKFSRLTTPKFLPRDKSTKGRDRVLSDEVLGGAGVFVAIFCLKDRRPLDYEIIKIVPNWLRRRKFVK
jgi:hypothetical protein